MWTSIIVLMVGAVLAAAAAFWVLRAYRRAGGGAAGARPALAACVAVILVGLGVYLFIGRPELPGASYAERFEALRTRDPTTFTVEETVVIWTEAARQHPTDPVPRLYLGNALMQMERPQEAARAYDAALQRDPQLAAAMLGLGRALVVIEGGPITPEALRLFEQAGALMNDPAPWIYQAVAAMEQGREADARRFWGEALARMSPEDPRIEMARRMSTGG